jgi:sortase (surface protein transpeptidase)
VVPVGIDAAQQLEIPGDIDTLGWWTGGARPGSTKGFVVITGHATREGDGAANAWWSAKPGQQVRLRTPRGTVSYRVVSRRTYDKADIPLSRWFPSEGPDGPPGLALITCADYRDGEWRANTVVEAVPA